MSTKTPEQKITDLEKRQEEIAKELAELKKEVKPSGLTLDEIVKGETSPVPRQIRLGPSWENKLLAIRDMIAVAEYLNGDWKPEKDVHVLIIRDKDVVVRSYSYKHYSDNIAYFKSEELAQQAIQILGEEKIKLALS